MKYLYYPGCSLKSTGRGYEESTLAVFNELNEEIEELDDWNCCGATAYMSISELKGFALSARNLAIAEKYFEEGQDPNLVVPCAACYLGLNKTMHYYQSHPWIHAKIQEALGSVDLDFSGRIRVRHPLDVVVNDIGLDRIKTHVVNPLDGWKVACYYGCQIIRPYADFDDQHNPTSMNKIMNALGAETIDWPLKIRCCGGSLTGTIPEVGLRLSYILLREAIIRGSDLIATACPLCQFNLECYQSKMKKLFGLERNIPVVYFTQLMGLAMGISRVKLGLHRLFEPLRAPRFTGSPAGGQHVAD